MQLRQLHPKDITLITNLHIRSMNDLMSVLGDSHVKKVYEILFSHLEYHDFYGMFENKNLVGLLVSTNSIKATHSILHSIIDLRAYPKIFVNILTFRISLFRIIERFLFELQFKSDFKDKYSWIIVLCVDPDWQRYGIGRSLVTAHIKKSRNLGIQSIYVDTRADNQKAIKFYLSIGYQIINSCYNNIIFKKVL